MSGCKLDGELLSYMVKDVPDDGLEGLGIGKGFRAQPLAFGLAPPGFDFAEVGDVRWQVEKVDVLIFPVRQVCLKGGAVVDASVVEHEHEHRGARAEGGFGIDDVNDEGRVK